ncbi:hypothetical protein FACS1894200_04830 [Spirochaetia bacterium]|nr:hypothetical protein FACS1894200_04830 [Spirochaetia bacterium]
MIRKVFVFLVVLSLVAGISLSADPIGLTVGIDGFGFGDVAADEYKFSGEGGQGSITPFIKFEQALDPVKFSVELAYTLNFTDPSSSHLDPKLFVGYDLSTALNFWVWDHIVISEADGTWNEGEDGDSNLGNKAELGLRYTLGLDFGSLYFQAEPGVYTEGKMLTIGALGDNEGFKIGVEKVAGGLYGYVQPILKFYESYDGESNDDMSFLTDLNIRVGYETGPINARVTVGIPTGSDKDSGANGGGIAERGLTITPRVTYTIMEGLSAYGDVAIGGIGADEEKGDNIDHVTIKPSIGVQYSF